ncbi:MAG: hypothetical protein ACI4LO_09640 [Anaerovoracaceae bacterium]
MYNTLSALISAGYYNNRAEAMLIVNTMFAGKAITAEEYTELIVLINKKYPESVEEVSESTEPVVDEPTTGDEQNDTEALTEAAQ